MIFFIIKYIRLNKRNNNLLQEKDSLSYSNLVKKEILIKAQIFSKSDDDSESEFI